MQLGCLWDLQVRLTSAAWRPKPKLHWAQLGMQLPRACDRTKCSPPGTACAATHHSTHHWRKRKRSLLPLGSLIRDNNQPTGFDHHRHLKCIEVPKSSEHLVAMEVEYCSGSHNCYSKPATSGSKLFFWGEVTSIARQAKARQGIKVSLHTMLCLPCLPFCQCIPLRWITMINTYKTIHN